MNCRHYRKTLIEIARNQPVAETLRTKAEHHTKQCPSCGQAFKDEKALTSLLREAAKSQATSSLPVVPEVLIRTFRSHDRDSIRPANTGTLILARVAVVLIFLTAGIFIQRRVSETLTDQKAKSSISGQLATTSAAQKPYIATEFIPIAEGEAAWETMQIVRVRLPRSALLEVGLPMNESHSEESILADVMISDEGLPYAIRFIKE